MSTLLSLVFSKLGAIVGLALVCFVAGVVVCWRWTHREKIFSEMVTVASVANGATIEAKAGLLGRSTRSIFLEGVAAPGLSDPLGPESQENLKRLAGDTVRVESSTRAIGARPLVGTCFGSTGANLALAQLRAGLAKCETGATADQIAAQREAQRAGRGLWKQSAGGSHWWHFGIASPRSSPLIPSPSNTMLENVGLLIEFAVVAIVVICLLWTYVGSKLLAKWSGATTVSAIVDTTEQWAAYAALTEVRCVPAVEADPQAVTACEYLRGVVTTWPTSAKTATIAAAAKTPIAS